MYYILPKKLLFVCNTGLLLVYKFELSVATLITPEKFLNQPYMKSNDYFHGQILVAPKLFYVICFLDEIASLFVVK